MRSALVPLTEFSPRGASGCGRRGCKNWPGSVVVIDTEERAGEPQLLDLLTTDRSALRARFGEPDPPSPQQLRRYEDVRRLLGRE